MSRIQKPEEMSQKGADLKAAATEFPFSFAPDFWLLSSAFSKILVGSSPEIKR
jgi:hypothetical protein